MEHFLRHLFSKLIGFSLVFLFMSTGCSRKFMDETLGYYFKSDPLNVRLEALTPLYLASCKVESPSPICHFCGQQLVITWSVLGKVAHEPLSLRISYITGIHTCEQVTIPIFGCSGNLRYRIINEEYKRTEGILTYKVELLEGNRLITTWKTRNWVEWIPTEDYTQVN